MTAEKRGSTQRFLVVIETQRVKGFLFGSPILRETRGASLLLDRLNRREVRQLARETSGDVVYLGGGSGRVLFSERSDAEELARRVQARYRQEAAGARVAAEVFERASGESFPDWVARGVRECRKRKLGRSEAVPAIAGRWIRPCSSCGVEPSRTTRRDVQGTHRLCRSCEQKRNQIADFYHEVKPRREQIAELPDLETLEKEWPNSVFATLAARLQEQRPGVTLELPQDFDAIGDASRPRNYTALIYADGDRMGQVVQRIAAEFPDDAEARAAYQAFSEITDKSTREAVVKALLEELLPEDGGGERNRVRLPAELVLAGGDDLVLVVPAHAALPVAIRFLELFQQISRRLQDEKVAEGSLARHFAPEGLTVSGGIVFAHASFPASQALDLAKELMKSAKRRAAALARDKAIEGTLDFLVLHESGTESALRRRRTEYESRSPSGRLVRRTERPYTASELATLLKEIRAMKAARVSRGKLKAVYEVLFRDPMRAQFDALRLEERLHATGAPEKARLADLIGRLPLFPFREKDGIWTTPLSELVELYEFVPPMDKRSAPEEARSV